MTTDPTVTYLLFQKAHEDHIAQAQRKHRIDQVVVPRGRHPIASAIGRRVGDGLVTVGERLQGMTPAPPAVDLQREGRG